jgi:hypothetical protein
MIDIAIIAASRLPEPMSNLVAFGYFNPSKSLWRVLFQPIHSLARNFFLDAPNDPANFDVGLSRCDDHMHMLWHEDIGPDINGLLTSYRFDRIAEPTSASFSLQKFEPLVTGERQLPRHAILIESTPHLAKPRLAGRVILNSHLVTTLCCVGAALE